MKLSVLSAVLLLSVVFTSGCFCCPICSMFGGGGDGSTVKLTYKCPDGTMVNDLSKCPAVKLVAYNWSITDSGILFGPKIKVKGELMNMADYPVYNVDVECKVYDQYNKVIKEDEWVMLTSDLHLYPNNTKEFEFIIQTPDFVEQVKDVICKPTYRKEPLT